MGLHAIAMNRRLTLGPSSVGSIVCPGRAERKNGWSGHGGSGDPWKPVQRRGADQPKSMAPNAAHSRTRVAASQTPA
jgi:hypothetical protein